MQRREFITLFGAAAGAWPVVAQAQQPATHVVGYLGSGSPTGFTARLEGVSTGSSENIPLG
jgi:hypothetical protein